MSRLTSLNTVRFSRWVLTGWLGVASAAPAFGLTLTIDYTHDAEADNLFGMFPAAKAAMEQAALDVGNLISSVPTEISNDYFFGTVGSPETPSAEVVFDLDLRYRNPSTGVMRQVDIPFLATGEVIMFVGSQSLELNELGNSEISSVKNTIFANVAGSATDLQTATGIASADAEAEWRRGGEGPVANTLSGPVNLGGTNVNYFAEMGVVAASIWFDTDTNNNGDADTPAQLAAFWHFDHTTAPPPNKFDFYSTAVHELLHGLGLGTAETYSQLATTSEGIPVWLGDTGQYVNSGSAFNLVHADGRHLREGLMSPRLSDGVMQEVILDPTIEMGVRKGVTLMDVALLQDVGWTLTNPIPIPEPGTLVWLGLLFGLRRRRA